MGVVQVRDHNHTLSLATEVAIEALVARVHAYEVPNLESNFVALHPQKLKLVVWPNRCLAILLEAVSDKPIDNRGFSDTRIAEHNYLE